METGRRPVVARDWRGGVVVEEGRIGGGQDF